MNTMMLMIVVMIYNDSKSSIPLFYVELLVICGNSFHKIKESLIFFIACSF
jgi:hypothetical protein